MDAQNSNASPSAQTESNRQGPDFYQQLKSYVDEALAVVDAERASMSEFSLPEEIVVNALVSPDPIAEQINKHQHLSDVARSRTQLIYRLKRFHYPYPEGNAKNKTFYAHLKQQGLLDVLLSPPLFWHIRLAWRSLMYERIARKQSSAGLSRHGYPIDLHRKVMNEICRHLNALARMAREAGVEETYQPWVVEYRNAALKQLLREACTWYPELLREIFPNRWSPPLFPRNRFTPSRQMDKYSDAVSETVGLFHAIEEAFATRGVVRHKLAYQPTALVATPGDQIRMRKLDPTPEMIRRNLRDRRKKERVGEK